LKSSHSSEIRQIDSEVDEYSNLLTEAQEKIASGNNTISELKETVKSYQGKLKNKDETLSAVQSNLKQFQEMYTKTAADISGIDPDSIYHSITDDTTPKQIDSLVEQYRRRIDRYNKLGISNTGLLESSNISIDTMKRNEEDERLMNLLIATQNSL
jgi:chromosome segregation ATPase